MPKPDRYAEMTSDEFDEILMEIMDEHPASHLLAVAGVYELVTEEHNNEVLERWERRHPEPDEEE